jgi:large subunit ribosomal protein L31
MKQGIHPEFVETHVTCSCGNSFTTRSVKTELHVELCNKCHPFYTGKQKLVDTGGRVERFQKKYAKRQQVAPAEAAPEASAPEEAAAPAEPEPVAVAAEAPASDDNSQA